MESYGRPDCIDPSDKPFRSNVFIHICLIHPGNDKYGRREERVRRLMFLSWMATCLVGEHAIDALAELKGREASTTEKKYVIM